MRKSESEVAQSCPTFSDPMDCSPPGSSVHGIFQARVLEWGAIAFSGVEGWKCVNVLLCYYQLLGKQRDKQRQRRILCWTDLYVFFHFFLLELMICSCSIVGFCTKTADLLSCCLYIISLCEMKVKWMWKLLSCVCDPMDCSPPGSSVLGILQARILEWVAIPFYRGSFRSRGWTQVFCVEVKFFTVWATREALISLWALINAYLDLVLTLLSSLLHVT